MDNADVYKRGWSVLGVMGVGGQDNDSNGEDNMAKIVINTLDKNIDDEETCKNCFRIIEAFCIKDGKLLLILLILF